MRPFSTVMWSVQESGQSSGQAVWTVECPQLSDSAGRAICADYLTAVAPEVGAIGEVDCATLSAPCALLGEEKCAAMEA